MVNVDRDVFQCLSLAIMHTDVFDLKGRDLVLKAGLGPGRRLNGSAEINPPYRLVPHHFFGAAGDDFFTEIHREYPIHEGSDALDVVIHQQHSPSFVTEAADQLGENTHFGERQTSERFVDEDNLWITGDRLCAFKPPQVRERQRRRATIYHAA